jgi:hypothetical protein
MGRFLFVALLGSSVAACRSQQPPAADPPASAGSWTTVRDALIEEYLKAQPAFAVYQGRHDYDGQLPDWSREGIASEVRRLQEARRRATDAPGLNADEAFERDYLVSVFDDDLFWIETAESPFRNPAWYLGVLDPSPYLTRADAPLQKRMRAYIRYAQSVQRALPQIRANLRTPLARPLLERGIMGFGGYAAFYRTDVPKVFAGIADAAFQKEFETANAAAAAAMQDITTWLESQRSSATVDYALGAERFARMLQMTEGVATPLAELEAAGRADLARNQQALRDECAKYTPRATIAACIAKMSANKQRSKVKGQRSKVKGQKSKVKSQRSKVKSQKSKVESQKSKVKSRKSKVKSQRWRSKVAAGTLDLCPLPFALCPLPFDL